MIGGVLARNLLALDGSVSSPRVMVKRDEAPQLPRLSASRRNPSLVLHCFGRSDVPVLTSCTRSIVQPFHRSLMWVVIIAQKLHVVLLFSIAFAGNKTQEKKGILSVPSMP